MTLKENIQMIKDYIEMSVNPDKDFDKYYRSRSRITLQVRDADEIISEKTIPARTHHVGLIGILQTKHSADQVNMRTSLYDRSGTKKLIVSSTGYEVELGSASAVKGIVAGTSDTSLDLTDYELTAKIAEGSSAGQFNYAATVFITTPIKPFDDQWAFQFDRDMVNNSGGVITVEEVGYYLLGNTSVFLGERTLVTQAVLDTQTFNVRYTERVIV